MNEQQKALVGLPTTALKVFRMIERYGPLSAPDLRVDGRIARDHPDEWRGHASGMTETFRRLMGAGLIRATRKRTRHRARIYEVTPSGEVEQQAARYRRSRPLAKPSKRSNGRTGILADIAEAKRLEKEAGTTARAHVIQARGDMLRLTLGLMRMKPMVFWKCTRDDEIVQVYEAAVRIEAWAKEIQAACDWDRTTTEMRERIRSLRNTNGRGEVEAEVFRRKADELEERLARGGD